MMSLIKPKYIYIITIALLVVISFVGFFIGIKMPLKYEDETIDISSFSTIGKLTVLTTDIVINEHIAIGDKEDPNYMSFYTVDGTAVYSIDLSKAELSPIVNNKAYVYLPDIEVDIFYDDSTLTKEAEYQKGAYKGSAEEGYEIAQETAKITEEELKENMQNNLMFMNLAKESAKKHITSFVNNLSVNNITIELKGDY